MSLVLISEPFIQASKKEVLALLEREKEKSEQLLLDERGKNAKALQQMTESHERNLQQERKLHQSAMEEVVLLPAVHELCSDPSCGYLCNLCDPIVFVPIQLRLSLAKEFQETMRENEARLTATYEATVLKLKDEFRQKVEALTTRWSKDQEKLELEHQKTLEQIEAAHKASLQDKVQRAGQLACVESCLAAADAAVISHPTR